MSTLPKAPIPATVTIQLARTLGLAMTALMLWRAGERGGNGTRGTKTAASASATMIIPPAARNAGRSPQRSPATPPRMGPKPKPAYSAVVYQP